MSGNTQLPKACIQKLIKFDIKISKDPFRLPPFYPFHTKSQIYINLYQILSTVIHFVTYQPFPSNITYFHPCFLIFIHFIFYPFSLNVINFHPTSSILINFRPSLSISIHFYSPCRPSCQRKCPPPPTSPLTSSP